MGVASAAAGLAGLTIIFSSCAWVLHGGAPAVAGTRAVAPGVSVFGTIHPPLLGSDSAALQGDLPPAPRVRFANLESTFASRFEPAATNEPATTRPLSSFDERFSFARSAPPSRSLQPALSFADRFGPATASGNIAPSMTAWVVVPATPAPRVAAPAPRAATRAVAQATQAAPKRPAASPYRLASLSDTPLPTAYASGDPGTKESGITELLKKLSLRGSTSNDASASDAATKDATQKDATAKDANPLAPDANHTAVYDISAHVVYLPSGKRLEAHSGLGEYMDDVRSVNLKSLGPTPPNVYELKLRESSFHGVEAIRLNPVGGDEMYGRVGILAHPFMLGPNGESNGCVSVKDYPAFLDAYKRGEITHLVVVERLDNTRTASDWLSSTLKGIFGRS